MQTETFISIILLISYVALCSDVAFQIHQISARNSSKDISIKGEIFRLVAVLLLDIKFIAINDKGLIVGQTILFVLLLIYTIYATRLRKLKKRK